MSNDRGTNTVSESPDISSGFPPAGSPDPAGRDARGRDWGSRLSPQSQLPGDTSDQHGTLELWPQALLTRNPRPGRVNRTYRNPFLQAALVDLVPSYNGLALPVSVSMHPEPAMVLSCLHFSGFSRHTSASGRLPILLGSQPSPLFPLPFE